jgi:broad specificity phosphatase PhoE
VPPPVYFVRHGETDWNRQGLIQGWTDTSLNDTGRDQAKAVGRSLAAIPDLARNFQFIVSPLQRARQTMALIAQALGLAEDTIAVESAVKELGFDVWEGKPFRELRASPLYPADPQIRYRWRPAGGESYADGRDRLETWSRLLDRPAVVVAHGAIGRCLIGHLSGLDAAALVGLRMPQGCYCRLVDGQAQWFDAACDAA